MSPFRDKCLFGITTFSQCSANWEPETTQSSILTCQLVHSVRSAKCTWTLPVPWAAEGYFGRVDRSVTVRPIHRWRLAWKSDCKSSNSIPANHFSASLPETKIFRRLTLSTVTHKLHAIFQLVYILIQHILCSAATVVYIRKNSINPKHTRTPPRHTIWAPHELTPPEQSQDKIEWNGNRSILSL